MRLSVVEARSVARRHSISEFTLGETVFFTHDQVLITPPPPPITLGVPLSLIAPFPPNCCHTLRSFTMLFSVMSAFSMARRLSPPPNPRRSSSSAPRRRASGFSRRAVARPLLCLSKRCAPGREIRGSHPSTGAPGAPDFAPSRDCAPSVPPDKDWASRVRSSVEGARS